MQTKNKVKAFYNSPSLLFQQPGSAMLMGYLNRWPFILVSLLLSLVLIPLILSLKTH
jgi:hypothetical protein